MGVFFCLGVFSPQVADAGVLSKVCTSALRIVGLRSAPPAAPEPPPKLKRRNEVFLSGPMMAWDIDAAREGIELGIIESHLERVNISDLVEKKTGLKEVDGQWTITPKSPEEKVRVHVNIAHAKTIDRERRDEPGILVRGREGQELVIDGNHRAARRYMDGERDMEFYIISDGYWGELVSNPFSGSKMRKTIDELEKSPATKSSGK